MAFYSSQSHSLNRKNSVVIEWIAICYLPSYCYPQSATDLLAGWLTALFKPESHKSHKITCFLFKLSYRWLWSMLLLQDWSRYVALKWFAVVMSYLARCLVSSASFSFFSSSFPFSPGRVYCLAFCYSLGRWWLKPFPCRYIPPSILMNSYIHF